MGVKPIVLYTYAITGVRRSVLFIGVWIEKKGDFHGLSRYH